MNRDGEEPGQRGNGVQAASNNKPATPSSSDNCPGEDNDGMKRSAAQQAARQLIEKYYFQLTDGCGRTNCNNAWCASCSGFTYKSITKNDAALKAIELFKNKAELCDASKPCKMPKASEDEHGETSGETMARGGTTSSSGESVMSQPSCSNMDEVGKLPTTNLTDASISMPTIEETSRGSKPKQDIKTLPSPEKKEIPYLTEEKLHGIIEQCQAQNNWSLLIRTIGSVFNNPEALLLSFHREVSETRSKEELRSMEVDLDKDTDEKEQCETEQNVDNSPEDLSPSSHSASDSESGSNGAGTSRNICLKDDETTVDTKSLHRSYAELFGIAGQPFEGALINALVSLARTVEMELKHHHAFERNPNYLNIFMIVLDIPTLHSPEFLETATPLFCKAVGQLPVKAQAKLARVWARYPTEKLRNYVACMQQLTTVKTLTTQWSRMYIVNDDSGITGAARVLKIVYYASILAGRRDSPELVEEERQMNESADENLAEILQGAVGHEPKEKSQPPLDPLEEELGVRPIDCREPLIPYEDFVNEYLSDVVEMDRDYAYYKSESEEKFSFMTHSFLLTTAVKNLGMYFDNRIRMMNERRASILQSLVHGAHATPYLRLRIRRDHIIDDALVALEMAAMDNPGDLKKQLYVEFEGEQGIDEGGVSKEFFQLVVEEIFNPDIGMFTHDDETKTFWFNPTSFENDGQFSLIGIVLGLAIYNNIILDIHFPMVVYRKLLGKKGTFEDLKDSHPTLAKSLQQMLTYEGDVEEAFLQPFCIGYKDVFGSNLTHELKENGSQVLVNSQNRKEFVELYADFLLNKAVERQFRAFKRGFQMVTDESPLKMLFRPDEVELLVCGSQNFDFFALEESTDYDGGFTTDSPTIRNFWQVVHEFDEEQKKQLLQFTTGSDRVPVGGLAKLKLIIARNGPDSDRLPTSHTCFNVLLLPDYTTKDKLKERLLKAITHAKGFGML